jgi:hypothetical protein
MKKVIAFAAVALMLVTGSAALMMLAPQLVLASHANEAR